MRGDPLLPDHNTDGLDEGEKKRLKRGARHRRLPIYQGLETLIQDEILIQFHGFAHALDRLIG